MSEEVIHVEGGPDVTVSFPPKLAPPTNSTEPSIQNENEDRFVDEDSPYEDDPEEVRPSTSSHVPQK